MQQPKQTDKYVDMSTNEACADCIKKGITKPSEIAKLTGKKINQVYTSLWHLRKGTTKKYKSIKKKMPAPYACNGQPEQAAQVKTKDEFEWSGETIPPFRPPQSLNKIQADWDREPTAYEDAHHVVLKSRAEYELELGELRARVAELEKREVEALVIIKYLEGKAN